MPEAPDPGVVALFVAAGISRVLGAGYTRYVETRHDAGWVPPEPDRITPHAQRVVRTANRAAAWAVAYHEYW